jgi:hypothetical protein
MLFNIFHLFIPPGGIHAECGRSTGRRNFVKPGFNDTEQDAAVGFLKLEDDKRRGLLRIIDSRIDGGCILGRTGGMRRADLAQLSTFLAVVRLKELSQGFRRTQRRSSALSEPVLCVRRAGNRRLTARRGSPAHPSKRGFSSVTS